MSNISGVIGRKPAGPAACVATLANSKSSVSRTDLNNISEIAIPLICKPTEKVVSLFFVSEGGSHPSKNLKSRCLLFSEEEGAFRPLNPLKSWLSLFSVEAGAFRPLNPQQKKRGFSPGSLFSKPPHLEA